MPSNRRDFLAAAAAGLVSAGVRPARLRRARIPVAPLRILILGGTGFIGPHQVQYALDRGHTVTLFNRGKTNPQLFPSVEKLTGDRAGDLESLKGRRWDLVIDNSATDPKWVELSAALLQKAVGRYCFVSTRSVYFDTSRVPMTIEAPVCTPENTPVEAGKPLPYCLAKALSEKLVVQYFGDRALIVRPSLIVGPGDLTDRFTYWPVRIDGAARCWRRGTGPTRCKSSMPVTCRSG